jgi:hypothetical protein
VEVSQTQRVADNRHVADGQRMNMLAHELYASSWILDLAWSQWQQISDTECTLLLEEELIAATAHLTFVDSEHDIFDTIVRRSVNATQDGWDLNWSTPVLLDDDSDGRTVTALKWIDVRRVTCEDTDSRKLSCGQSLGLCICAPQPGMASES